MYLAMFAEKLIYETSDSVGHRLRAMKILLYFSNEHFLLAMLKYFHEHNPPSLLSSTPPNS